MVIDFLEKMSDIGIRDPETDAGDGAGETDFDSPDIIVRSQLEPYPQLAFAEESKELLGNSCAGHAKLHLLQAAKPRRSRRLGDRGPLCRFPCDSSCTPDALELVGTVSFDVPHDCGHATSPHPLIHSCASENSALLAIVGVGAQPSLAPAVFSNIQNFGRIIRSNRRVAVRNVHKLMYSADRRIQSSRQRRVCCILVFECRHRGTTCPVQQKTREGRRFKSTATSLKSSKKFLGGPTGFISKLPPESFPELD